MKILLVEENPVDRNLAKTLLEKHGHAIMTAENGREAIDAVGREQIDVVLMDVQMPINGLDVTRAIRAKVESTGGHTHIIALTAHATKGGRKRCLDAGADDHLTKPIRVPELLEALDRVKAIERLATAPSDGASPPRQGRALDVAAAMSRVEGDSELLEELVALFADEIAKNLHEIHQALAAADAPLLERLAHTVKGSAANIGATFVSGAALALEEQARSRDLATARVKVEALEIEILRLRPELESLTRKTPHS